MSTGAWRRRNAWRSRTASSILALTSTASRHSPSVNRFGFFGQFIDNKGVDVILEALLVLGREQRIPPEGIVIEINGGNKHYATQAYLERITRHIDELKKIQSGRIEVRERGPYGRDQLAERMGSVDWVLVPSTWWEIFGLVVSEGWMFGRPVIASSIAALKERIIPGINGLTFTVRDSRALADVMASAVGNERQWLTLNQGIEQPWSEIEMLEATGASGTRSRSNAGSRRPLRPSLPRSKPRSPSRAQSRGRRSAVSGAAKPGNRRRSRRLAVRENGTSVR